MFGNRRRDWQTWDRWREGWSLIAEWSLRALPGQHRCTVHTTYGYLWAIKEEIHYLLWTHWRGYPNTQPEDR